MSRGLWGIPTRKKGEWANVAGAALKVVTLGSGEEGVLPRGFHSENCSQIVGRA